MTDSMGVEPEGETAKIVCTEKEIVQGIKKTWTDIKSIHVFSKMYSEPYNLL